MDPYSDHDFAKGKELLLTNQISKAKETFNCLLMAKFADGADIDEYSTLVTEMAELFKPHCMATAFHFLKNGFYYVLREDPENEDEFHDITLKMVEICSAENELYNALTLMKSIVEETKAREEKTNCYEWLMDRIRQVYLQLNQAQRGVDYFVELMQDVLIKNLRFSGIDCIGLQIVKLQAHLGQRKECSVYITKLADTIYNHVGVSDVVYDISWITAFLYDDIMTSESGLDSIRTAYMDLKNGKMFSFADVNTLMFRIFEIREIQKNLLFILQRNHEKVPEGWQKEYSQEVVESVMGDVSELNDIFEFISCKMNQLVDS